MDRLKHARARNCAIRSTAAITAAAVALQRLGFHFSDMDQAFGVPASTLWRWVRKSGPTDRGGISTRSVHRYILTGRYQRQAVPATGS